MAKIKGAVVVNTERCKGCNLCVVACPSDVLELHPREVNNKGYHYVYMKNPDACIGCASCGLVCPDGCLTIYKVKNIKLYQDMAEDIKLMKGNEAIAHAAIRYGVGRLLRLSDHSAVGDIGNPYGRDAVGKDRHGSLTSGERGSRY